MMEAGRWALVKRVFRSALDLPVAEREEFVRVECGPDAELRTEVESLLAAHAEAGSFAEQPAVRRLGWSAVESSSPGRDSPRLETGSHVGPYEISALIGEGGMGQVWRARHDVLGRDDALKVLPNEFIGDPDRLARFRREARVLASLNHPNIAHVYGLEQGDGVLALVMELIPGETLADRLEVAGRSLPINEALGLARQITDGIEAAHEQGIVHRDLKPSNIKIRPDGTVKVLDFGLAKALRTEDGGADVGAANTAVTSGRVVLGTPCYMSPEQARGQDVDRRTDIWAFGCVLYEMLTGRRAFDGTTSSDVIARVLECEPDYDALPTNTPMLVRRLLRRCLEKDLKRRLRDIADARIDLDDTQYAPLRDNVVAAARPAQSRVARSAAFIGIAAVVVAVAIAAAAWLWPASGNPGGGVHMTALLPPGASVTRGPGMLLSLAISPDGRTLVIAGTDATGQRLYQRTLDRLEATPLAGTEGALCPFFSPDGAWIGFFADRRLKRVPVGGGTAIDITATAGYPAGASWGNDDRIVYAAGYLSPLWIVDARGGRLTALTKVNASRGHLYPRFCRTAKR